MSGPMVYEIRSWFENRACMFTNDVRVKDMALRATNLRVTATYFRTARDLHPFAWDIVGDRLELAEIAARFERQRRRTQAATVR